MRPLSFSLALSLALAVLLSFVSFGDTPAAAAESAGRVNAVASAPIPAGVAIAVAAKEASERNGVLQPAIEADLQARGYTVDPRGPWQLRFATAVELLPRDRSIVHLLGRVGSDSRADLGLEVPLPQWPGLASPDGVYRYNVWMTFGQAGRPAIWQGAATAVLTERESIAADKALAGALLAVFGQTVADQPLPAP